jgi:ribosomal protein S18 acetylase RimI-like enzyme
VSRPAPPVLVRTARADEYDAIAEMTVATYGPVLGPLLDEEYKAELSDVAGRARDSVVLVAEGDDGRLLGSVTYVPGPGRYGEFAVDDEAGIRMLAVPADVQRRGVGTALVAACIERARVDERARIVLFTAPPMVAAQRLYEAVGFRRAPKRDWSFDGDLTLMGYVLEL